MAIDPNVPAIANAITGAVDNWNGFISNQRDWSAGTATGGPANDGYYPLKNSLGITYSLPSPAKLVALTTGPMSQAVAIQSDVANAKTLVLSTANTVALNLSYVLANTTAAAGWALAASGSASNSAVANASSWIARDQSNAILTSVTTMNATVSTAVGTTSTLASQANASATKSAANAALSQTYAAQAGVYASQINPASYATANALTSNVISLQAAIDLKLSTSSFTYTALPGKPTYFPTDTANVAGLSTALAAKADLAAVDTRINANATALNSTITTGLAGKANTSHTHVIADVTSLQATLDGKLGVNQGLSTGYAAWSVNSLGIDSYQGEGQLNLMGGAVLAKTANASATGHVFLTTARSASRIGLHDQVINLYSANTASGTAGQPVTWIQTASISTAAANFLVQPQFGGVNLATMNDLTTGLATKQANLGYTPANVAGATFTGAVTMNGLTMQTGGITLNSSNTAEQTITGKLSDRNAYLYWNANYVGLYSTTGVSVWNYDKTNFNVGVNANLTAGATVNGALNVTGAATFQNSVQVGNGIGTGFYGDGGNVAIRGYSAGLIYIQSNAGGSTFATFGPTNNFYGSNVFSARPTFNGATPWDSGNLAPMTTNTGQTVTNAVTKEFQTKAGDLLGTATGQGYAGALGVIGPGSSDTYNQALMSFHRPGVFAAHFGLNSSSKWVVGGWSYGNGVQKRLWIDGEIPTNAWQKSDDGKDRFYFAASGDSIWKTNTVHYFRNGADTTIATIDNSGTLSVNGEIYTPGWIRVTSSNGIYWNAYGGGWNMSDTSWMRSYGDKGIYTAGTMLAGAMQAGTVTATSDARFKSHIRDLEPVAGLVPKRFVKDGKERLGYIAQDVQATAAKEAVHDQFGANGEHSLSLEPLAMLAAVHAQLSAEIADLRARL